MSVLVGNRLIILNSRENNPYTDRLPVVQGKGRAFGSGDHETTRSCLEQLEKIHLTKKAKVLDVGCGSGILSIAASRLGAGKVMAFDPDPHAITTARANIDLNDLKDSILLFRGELSALKAGNYSLIMANLYGDILLSIMKDLCRRLAPGAILLLSGILYDDVYDIKKRASAGNCRFIKSFFLQEYTTVLFKKKAVL